MKIIDTPVILQEIWNTRETEFEEMMCFCMKDQSKRIYGEQIFFHCGNRLKNLSLHPLLTSDHHRETEVWKYLIRRSVTR